MAHNRIVHFEIPSAQPEALSRFYGELFGWSFAKAEVPGLDYFFCSRGGEEGGPGITGAVLTRTDDRQRWTNYVDVASIDEAVEKATALGARVALAKMPVPGGRSIAALVDPEGNIFGLIEGPEMAPESA
ncbi:VOC family protein [Singulisphaera sp. PoT]|uniref:VOC family protein n=1 Tax=Singulisphaera sp. PoT TaxID=3411797 RepID=UPI003BF51721